MPKGRSFERKRMPRVRWMKVRSKSELNSAPEEETNSPELSGQQVAGGNGI